MAPNVSWGWSKEAIEEIKGKADQARNGDIDWCSMRKKAMYAAEATYDVLEEATAGLDPSTEKTYRDIFVGLEDEIEDIKERREEARKRYAAQPWCAAVMALGEKDTRFTCFFDDALDAFCVHTGGRDQYIEKCMDGAISTYAVLVDGVWNAPGDMGWWGMSSENDKEREEFRSGFYGRFIEPLSDEALITIVDCHI